MQTKEQIKNWKVVASVATVAALGVSGLAVASPGEPSQAPPPIEIEDGRPLGTVSATTTTAPQFQIVPGPSVNLADDSLDSPLASADLDSPSQPPATAPAADDSPDVADSPAPAPVPAAADDSADSPAPAPAPAPADDSADSADSADSLDS